MQGIRVYICSVAIAALLAGDCWVSPIRANSQPPNSPPNTSSSKQSVAQEVRLVKKPLAKMFRHKGVQFEGHYPHFQGQSKAAVTALNADVDGYIKGFIPGDEGWGDGEPSITDNKFSCDYKLGMVSDDFVSISYYVYHYFGGAHGSTNLTAINYQLRPKVKKMTLGDVLGARANYKLLDRLLLKKLRAGAQGDQIDGEVKTFKDDERFYFDRKGLTWQTGEYCIGPYVVGTPSATFTYQELSKVAAPGSLALDFLNHRR